jgi:E3 ubiquitin-protein ligase RGLG
MGCSTSSPSARTSNLQNSYRNRDSLDEAMIKSGVVEDINFLIFVDFTKSNNWTGKYSFYGKNLHDLHNRTNRYLTTLQSLHNVINADQDGHIATYAYGTTTAYEKSGHVDFQGCFKNVQQLTQWYVNYSQNPRVRDTFHGPTTLKYVLDEAQRVTKETKRYHIVLILTDGDPDDRYKKQDVGEVYDATNDPLSIVVIGVGDGKYDKVNRVPTFPFYEGLDDNDGVKMGIGQQSFRDIKQQYGNLKFDNLQFVNLEKEILQGSEMTEDLQEKLYLKAFSEIPKQYDSIKKCLNYNPSYGGFTHPSIVTNTGFAVPPTSQYAVRSTQYAVAAPYPSAPYATTTV